MRRQTARAYHGAVDGLAAAAGVILVGITAALVANVGFRLAGAGGLRGMVDAIEHGLMAATFLAAPWVLKHKGHVAVDLLLGLMGARGRLWMGRLVQTFGALVSLVFAWSSVTALLIAFERGSMVRGILVVPEWIPLLAPSLAGLLLAIEFARQIATGASPMHGGTGL